MKEPANWRSLLSGMMWMGPPGGHRMLVGKNTNWNWTKAASIDGCSAWDLIYYNFRTRDPLEVNWYLYHFVGCRYSSDGGVNLNFHWANPGIVFTRTRSVPPAFSAPYSGGVSVAAG
jgi:hypothetical protein